MRKTLFIVLCIACVCLVRHSFGCPCLHGGTCVENRCECPPKFDGPNCENIKFSLTDGEFLLPSKVLPSETFHFSLRFKAGDEAGTGSLLSFSKRVNATYKHVFVLGLDRGQPTLLINDELKLHLNLGSQPWNDDKWCAIHVVQTKSDITLLGEKCQWLQTWNEVVCVIKSDSRQLTGAVLDMTDSSMCLGLCNNNENFKIASNEPLLNHSLTKTCIAEILVNDALQDTGDLSDTNSIGCGERACGLNKRSYGKCGKNSICYGNSVENEMYFCECKYGYARNSLKADSKCDIKVSAYSLPSTAAVKWETKSVAGSRGQFNFYETQFRTVKSSGTLVVMEDESAANRSEMRLEIENSSLKFKIGEFEYKISDVNVSNGEWTTVRLKRIDSLLQIFLMNNATLTNRVTLIPISKDFTFWKTRLTGGSEPAFEGCMTDAKMLPHWSIFPMQQNRDSDQSLANVTGEYLSSISSKDVSRECTGYTVEYCQIHHPCRSDQNSTVVKWRTCGCKCADPEKIEFPNSNECVFKNVCLTAPCKNNGTCGWNGTSYEDRNFTCVCLAGYTGSLCEIFLAPPTKSPIRKALFPWWIILLLCILLLLLILLVLCLFCVRNRRRRDADTVGVFDEKYDVNDIYQNVGPDEVDGGGEQDYLGKIDFSFIRKPKKPSSAPTKASTLPVQAPDSTPLPRTWKNPALENDDHLDHTLEYGYEGAGSSVDLSSIASGSTDADLNLTNLNNWGHKFRGLSQLYN